MLRSWQEKLFDWWLVRVGLAGFFTIRGSLRLVTGRRYAGLDDFCWILRVSGVRPFQWLARRVIDRRIAQMRAAGRNTLIDDFRRDPAAAAVASVYVQSGGGPHDLFRDFIVLKSPTATEKGVVLLKYARTFSGVAALLDLERLMQRYTFVLEPCWAGYCDPSILMFFAPGNPVVVQCFTESDHRFIESLGAPFVAVRLGPADWVDADIFAPPASAEKIYDIVMVANWAAHKRHAQLFRALRDVRGRKVRVLLVGFPWADRTADDIRREAARYRNDDVELVIIEKLPQTELAGYVSRSKVFAFLSRKEGDNKALVEAMFADVPAIVYDRTVGGATSRINDATGVLASDAELGRKIEYMLDNYRTFSPRHWALEHTGSRVATRVLDDALRAAAGASYGTSIAEKVNAPNLAYKDPALRARFASDYRGVMQDLLPRWQR